MYSPAVEAPTTTPDLTAYEAVHTAIRVTCHRLVAAAARIDVTDGRRIRALHRYWRGFAGEVLLHHTVEDEIFFPALRERVPVAGPLLDHLDAEHHDLDAAMARCETALGALAVTGQTDDLVPALRQFADLMDVHLDLEDAEVLPLFVRHFDAAEYDALHQRAMESTGLDRQLLFTVPFLVSMCTPEQRASLMDGAPLPLRVVYRLTRRPHRRLARRAFGAHALKGVTW